MKAAAAPIVPKGALRWIVRHRAWSRYHLVRYLRYLRFRLRHRANPGVVVQGMIFLGRHVEVSVRPGYGRLVLGPWVHIGDDCRIRVHEGSMWIGERSVLGRDVTLTGYLDVELGARCLLADSVYVVDFDHRTDLADVPVKGQGIVKSPVRIGPDCWLGTKSVVLRGAWIGRGSVVGAGAVVRPGEYPALSVLVGVPARLIGARGKPVLRPVRPPAAPGTTSA